MPIASGDEVLRYAQDDRYAHVNGCLPYLRQRHPDPRDRVLLLLNERDEWDLPGGRPDPGEDHRAALEREVREETGLAVEVGDALDEHLFEVLPGRFVRILPFVCRLVGRR